MKDRIVTLGDLTAIRLLMAIARPRLRAGSVETELTPGIQGALRDAFGETLAGEASSEGDLARAALLLLIEEEPNTREAIAALLDGPRPESFVDAGEAIALTVAALVVLQTHIKFKRSATGKWTLELEKQPTKDSLLKPLVQKLLALIPGTGPR